MTRSDARRRASRRVDSTHGATLFAWRVRRARASLVKLALTPRTAAVLGCLDTQRRAATGRLPRWLDTRHYAFRSVRDASRYQLGGVGRGTAYSGSAPLLFMRQRRAAMGLLPRWLDTQRYAFRLAHEVSKSQLCEAGIAPQYGSSARLLWHAPTRGDEPAAALARHSALRSSLGA